MRNLWSESDAKKLKGNQLKLRVYTSRLLGSNPDLVMHGGGNTSVKIREVNIFEEEEEILYVKGSGWDLGTIEAEGFAPVRMRTLLQMAELPELSDMDMVKYQRMAMTNPAAPNPSVEAVLHAIIPYRFVDHTHADAVVTITNTPGGKQKIQEIFGDRIMIIPYVMPGFVLARKIYQMTRGVDWKKLDGMILMNHGVFTFNDSAKESYLKMIQLVSKAERYLSKHCKALPKRATTNLDTFRISKIRKEVADIWGKPLVVKSDTSASSVSFSKLKNLKKISTRGPITPDHIIRTKRTPVVIENESAEAIRTFVENYKSYFKKYRSGSQKILDQAPRWAIVPGKGALYFGTSLKNIRIIEDIVQHTQKAIFQAEQIGGWKPLDQAALFEMEYWSLEQAKLGKAGNTKPMQGKSGARNRGSQWDWKSLC